MQSTRFDGPSLAKVRRAAEHEGVSVSEFIRRAALERAASAPEPTILERLGDAVGRFSCGPSPSRADDAFGDALEADLRRQSEQTMRRRGGSDAR